jgi:type I restriction enzyme S subunit
MSEALEQIHEARPRRFRPYSEYKDSGVELLGEIPAHWKLFRLRFVVDTSVTKKEVRDLDPEPEVSFVPMEAVGEYGGLILDGKKPLTAVVDGYTYFRDGDVVVA